MASIDLIRASNGSGDAVKATVTNARVISSTTIQVAATTNWPSKFIATVGSVDGTGAFVPATVTVFNGTSSGGNIEITSFAPGYTDLGNTPGQIVVLKPTTAWANEMADTLAVSHNDNGTMKANSVTTTAITDANVTTAKIADTAITASKIDFTTLAAKFLLAYAQRTTSFAFGSTTVDNPGVSITFTTTEVMPVTIEFWAGQVLSGQNNNTRVDTFITRGDNTVLAAAYNNPSNTRSEAPVSVKKSYESLSAGTYTFKVRHVTPSGTGTVYAGSESPMFIKAYIG